MNEKTEKQGMLSPYRVLDLSDIKGWMCGKLLGDLGADVIKIEPPGGDSGRALGPFFRDDPHPEKSLGWFAYNLNKRGITLNIGSADGRELFKRLVLISDFVIESFPPGYLDSLGLGYSDLEKLRPEIIMVSITPFGPTGPYRDYKSSDLVLWALGLHMEPYGDADRAPVRVSHEFQSYLNAGAQAAATATIALYQRWATGEGQHIDLSIQEIVGRMTVTASWDQNKRPIQRGGIGTNLAGNVIKVTYVWPCKDGDVVWLYGGGPLAPTRVKPLIEWMEEDGVECDYLKNLDWLNLDMTVISQEVLDRVAEPTIKFFMKHTKDELFEGAIKRRLFLYPASTVDNIAASAQLAHRGFWVPVEHPELSTTITYPGAFTHATETPPTFRYRAPLIGEHNCEIYQDELGLSAQEMVMLKQAGVI